MKIAFKLIFFVLSGIIFLLAIDGYFTVRREIKLFDEEMKLDGLVLGNAMKEMIKDVWQSGGQQRVIDLIKHANEGEKRIYIRWVWLDSPPGDTFGPRCSKDRLGPVFNGRDFSLENAGKDGNRYLYTYIPVKVYEERMGAIELSEPLSELTNYIHGSILRSIALIGVIVLLSAIVLIILGVRVIGRPLDKLVEKTRQIGTGDFSGDVVVKGGDELSTLASEINQMCRQLETAQNALKDETKAHISALEQLRHSERLATLGRLSSGMAHELGTPLNVIDGRAKIIIDENLERVEVVEYCRIIRNQIDRMTRILKQLLDFARRRTPNKSPTDIVCLSKQILEMLNSTAKKQQVTLEFSKSDDIPIVNIDLFQIEQVIINIIMNGIQAMPNGGKLKIDLNINSAIPALDETEQEKQYIALCIRDEGKGISKDDIIHIFEPFFTTKDIGKGTGLGLSIAFGIIQEHGGWIDVESEPGKGSCFTVYLPQEA